MNQILANVEIELQKEKEHRFKYFFIFSLSILFLLSIFFGYIMYNSNLNQKTSRFLQYNYETMQLYASSNLYTNLEKNNSYTQKFIIGKIEIPTLKISYPIFSILDDETLKISPCIFHGKMPPEGGNLCIAGHNYNNNQFFSLIYQLKNGDDIVIYDNNNRKYTYSVFANYEVKTDDLSPISNISFKHELTLVTCNNFNNHRIIIKAKY